MAGIRRAHPMARTCLGLWVAVLLGATGCSSKGYRIILPDAYVGWVRVDFRVPGAPTLPVEDGFEVLTVPENGVVITTSDVRASPAYDEVFFGRSGLRVRAPYYGRGITRGHSTLPNAILSWWVFFGPEGAIRTEEAQRKVNGDWIPGRLKSVPAPK